MGILSGMFTFYSCLFLVPDSQLTATELFQSPLYTDLEQSSAAYHVCSVTSCLLSSLVRHTSSNSVTRNYCCRAC